MLTKNRVLAFLCILGIATYSNISVAVVSKKIVFPNDFVIENAPIILEQDNFQPFTGIVTGKKVRLRNAPKLDSSILKEVSIGELLPIVGEVDNFYCIRPTPDMKGFVFHTFIINGSIEGDQVNVRAAPSTLSPILCKLHKGEQVITYEKKDNWVEIELPFTCHFYISKEFVEKKGDISLVNEMHDQIKIANDLIEQAVVFAERELKKPFSHINLEEVYQNINTIREGNFKNLPGIESKIENELEKIQQTFLNKKEGEAKQSTVLSNSQEKSRLSKHLRRIDPVKKVPALKNYEEIEDSLYKLWLSDLPVKCTQTSMEDFYKSEHKKQKTLIGKLEIYPHVIKNSPGQFLLKNNSRSIAFLYSTNIDLTEFLNQEIRIVGIPRSNNYFAFPAFFVTSAEIVSK